MRLRNHTLGLLAATIGAFLAANATAGELVSAYSTIGNSPGVRFLNPDFTPAGTSFTTPGQAGGLAVGDNAIFGGFSSDHTLRRFSVAGTPQITLTGNSDFMPGPLAFGNDTVFQAFTSGGTNRMAAYTATLGVSSPFLTFDSPVTGLAFGNDSLFISFGDTLQRRDLSGNLLQSSSFSGIFTSYALGPLAFGGGELFMGYSRTVTMGDPEYHIAYLDPDTLAFNTSFIVGSEVRGLAHGDGQLFASYENKLVSYDGTGIQTDALVTALFGMGTTNGALAYLPDGDVCRTRVCDTPTRAVPEPATWALLILGFGGVGAMLRGRRRVAQGLV